MAHPLVDQLRFARHEFQRGLADVAGSQAQQRFGNLTCISWIVGHLAWQEQRYWLTRAQGETLLPDLNERLASGRPACTPGADEMWTAWRQITQAADAWLDDLTPEAMGEPLMPGFSSVGTFMQRTIYHYWFHLGEGLAVRQLLGHSNLPDFVGDIDGLAPFRTETSEPVETQRGKDRMLELVQSARARWEHALSQVSQEQMESPMEPGGWSLKDVMAHLTWHEKEMLGVLRSRVFAGSDLWLLTTEERNQAIYQQQRELPLSHILSESEAVYSQLEQELERLEDDDLIDPARIQDLPPDWRMWDVLAGNTFLHYQDHLNDLKSWLKRM